MLNQPFEFIVQGTSTRRQDWKRKVATAARVAGAGQPPYPTSAGVQLRITYYYDSVAPIDVDNMIKPIQDALIGLVYIDDCQVTDVLCRKREVPSAFVFHRISDTLYNALTLYDDFVYVVLDQASEPRIIEP